MNQTKKFLCTLVAALTLATSTVASVACGGTRTDSGENTGGDVTINEIVPYDGSEVKLTFYHTMGADLRAVLDKAITSFNAIYPNITIEHTTQGDYDGLRDQIAQELSSKGGKYPNLATCYPDHVALYNKSKKVLQLDHYIESEETIADTTEITGLTDAQKADFIPAFYAEGNVYGDGYTYTLPLAKSTEVLFYNKTYFDANGYKVPTTWDEMEALCKTIKEKESNNVIPLGYDSESNWFITMTEQLGSDYTTASGSDHFLFDNEENRAFVERFTKWYQKGYVTTQEILGGTYTSNLFTETAADKMKCYMCIGSTGGTSYQTPTLNSDGTYSFEVGIAMIPQVNPEKPKVIQQGPSICLFKKEDTQEQAAAWLFAKYLTTNVEFQARYSMQNGYTPVIQSVQENEVYAQFLAGANTTNGLKAATVKFALEQMDAYYVSPAFEGSSAARQQVGLLMQACFTNAPKDGSISDFIKSKFKSTIDTLIYDLGY